MNRREGRYQSEKGAVARSLPMFDARSERGLAVRRVTPIGKGGVCDAGVTGFNPEKFNWGNRDLRSKKPGRKREKKAREKGRQKATKGDDEGNERARTTTQN